ncbi:DUF481 domain-containing protein [Actomonas aquatica]|uniref:DUF481 domain-containing protein n=1 Tax=Actomonas aquatica TaxID=2866162 RepID=A0ABZ1CD90_9BACT|nr:DUF481 domain-containing protein [Opitutus sp. WL0086]WRQ89556.1 DUF481 domain-containing protein [Opitutus sp. WL0086]
MQHFFRLRLPFLLSGLVLAVANAGHAAELLLTNGDRLTGLIVNRTAEAVVLSSTMLGEIEIPVANIDRIDTESGLNTDPIPEEKPVQAEETQVVKAKPQPAPPVAPPTPKPDSSPTPAADTFFSFLNPWSGKLELGFRQIDGRTDATHFDFRASAESKMGRNSLKASARLLYSEQDTKVTNERYDGSFRWRRELGERTFAQTLTSYYRDPIKLIDNNWEQNVGAGYRLFKNDDHTINVGAGLTAQYRQTNIDDGSVYALVEVFQDYSYQISEKVKFSQNAVAQYSPDGQARFISVGNQPSVVDTGESNYKLRFDTTLQGTITRSISLNLRYEYEFDNAVATEDARADQRIISSIGYGF